MLIANEITPTVILTLSRPKAGPRLRNHNEGAGPLVPVPRQTQISGETRRSPGQGRKPSGPVRRCAINPPAMGTEAICGPETMPALTMD